MATQEPLDQRSAQLREYINSFPPSNFKGQPQALINAIDNFTSTGRGMMTFKQAKLDIVHPIFEAMHPKPKVILEFGCYVGRSALAWGTILREFHGPNAAAEGARVYTFELNQATADLARGFVQLAGLDDIVHVLAGPASESVKTLYKEGRIVPGGVDVAFFDHWEKYYLPDLQLCESLQLFHKGSLAVADNTDYPGAPDYLKHVRAGGSGPVRYETKTYESTSQGPNLVEISTVAEV